MISCGECIGDVQCVECAAADDAEAWYTMMEIIDAQGQLRWPDVQTAGLPVPLVVGMA